jgi:hypothetical protein
MGNVFQYTEVDSNMRPLRRWKTATDEQLKNSQFWTKVTYGRARGKNITRNTERAGPTTKLVSSILSDSVPDWRTNGR